MKVWTQVKTQEVMQGGEHVREERLNREKNPSVLARRETEQG